MDILRQGPDALASLSDKFAQSDLPVDKSLTLESMRFLPPIGRPGKIICLGLNYADHAAEGGHSRPEYPSVFLRSATSLVAHGQNMILPECSEQLDYEAELAVIIGTRCKNVPVEKAQEVIAGYSCFNDGSIRDYQRKTAQWTVGKNFDATGAFGPFFVSVEELPPAAKGLRIQTRLNGVVMQDANTSDMLFPVEEAIAILSECMTLEPGDVIVTGTPAGVGAARKPPVWMKANDLVEVEIEGIGILSNTVASQKQHGSQIT
ncbi:5-oxopent-3-ene-1,2,5-tricarboxylate decarboxylase [Orrella marina]|uniref:5-oxopent-3-ene-1,2,5-tricarboxylate decarboxylase n=2 Tax=Orrella marina TaxID=2163011 RepID=A0A2R4XPU0_9BURK|nr:5-oxopent-3-ene-1,2,5-tricarboxylate decarboxylase [Orrella marina]